MKTVAKKLYEGMFLVDSAVSSADWDGVVNTITTMLEKTGAEIESIKKWDSRKLVYQINGKAYGTYVLSYFRTDGSKIHDIERDVQLSESVMRVMILVTEKMTKENFEKETPIMKAERREREIREKASAKAKAEEEQASSARPEEEKQTEQSAEVAESDDSESQQGESADSAAEPENPAGDNPAQAEQDDDTCPAAAPEADEEKHSE